MKQDFIGFKALKQQKKLNKKVIPVIQSEIEETETQEVFKGADKIWYQILWDNKVNKLEFTVGYKDRFVGIIEEPFSTFEALKEDIPFHRIKYYKRGNEIVWDREKKINKL